MTLTGTNTHGGGTELQGGVLSITSDTQLGAESGMLAFDGGTLRNDSVVFSSRAVTIGASGGSFETQADLLLSGNISGAGPLVKTGGDSLVITGDAGHAGGTTISAGTLRIGDGGNTGSLSGDVENNATLAFNRSDAASFAGAISGSGRVVKSGGGRLVLSGSSSYSGGTTVDGGTLSISADDNLGAGTLTLDGGTLLQTTAAVTTMRAITIENAARFQTTVCVCVRWAAGGAAAGGGGGGAAGAAAAGGGGGGAAGGGGARRRARECRPGFGVAPRSFGLRTEGALDAVSGRCDLSASSRR